MTSAANHALTLSDARAVLPDRVIANCTIEVVDGRIARIAESPGNAFDGASFDSSGLTIFPGFIDLHIHGAAGVDVNSADASGMLRVAEFLASKGVTAWLPTLVPAPVEQYQAATAAIGEVMKQQAADATSRGARVLGVHYEGPFVNSEQCGALHREYFRTFGGAAEVDSIPRVQTDSAVHLMTVAPEIEGGVELIRELRARGWIVSIGHTRATPDVLDKARQAGAQHMTHFMNAMSPLHHRAPGPVGWGLLNDDVSLDVIADGMHLDPMMLKVLLRCVKSDRLTLISDAIAATGLGDGEYEIWGEKITVENGRTRNARGRIAGSVITMLDAMKAMLSLGASECDVARMASLNPARLLGIDSEYGSIAEGKRADLVVLNSHGEVQLAVNNGAAARP